MEIKWYIFLSLILFCIGIIGALTRRNSIIVFMCIELMLNSVNLLLVAFSKMHMAVPNAFGASMATGAQIFCILYYDIGRRGSECGPRYNCYAI